MKSDLFGTIRQIDVCEPKSWNCIFLTFDIDWADDQILEDTLDLVRLSGLKATWFVTHSTPVLQKISNQSEWELGIHPNFNFLLEGKATLLRQRSLATFWK